MKRKSTRGFTAAIIVACVMTMLFAAAASIAIMFSMMLREEEADNTAYREQAELDLSALEGAKNEAAKQISELKNQCEVLENECSELAAKIEAAEKEKADLISTFEDTDSRYRELNKTLEALNAELASKQEEIAGLEESIARLESVYSVDINAQFDILNQLNDLLESGAPMRQIPIETEDEDGNTVEATDEVYPRIAVYYEDLTRGYTFSYNANEVFDSASCMKAPFALSILMAASKEQEEYERLLAEAIANMPETEAETDENGNPIPAETDENGEPVQKIPEIDFNRVYDFDKIFTYTSDKSESGSGIIKDSEDGTEYTYLELMEYMLRYSDNVAYKTLKSEYGTQLFASLAYKLNTTALKKNLSQMTAADGGKVMKAIYEFIDSGEYYSQFMYEAMTTSVHTVMIPYSVGYSRKVAHKYGWDVDAYHDMGIVFDNNPYVVVFMSDMDTGGTEVDKYIQQVLKLIDSLHRNFYKSSK